MISALICTRRRDTSVLALLVAVFCLVAAPIGCGEGGPGADDAEGDDGDDERPVPIEGTYRVLSQMRNDDGCDEEGSPHSGDDYFALEEVEDGRSAIGYFPCDSNDDCEPSGEPTIVFDELYEEEGHWRGTSLDWEQNGDACEMSRTENIARLRGGELQMERRNYGGTMSEADECSREFAEEQQGNLICERYDEITATELE